MRWDALQRVFLVYPGGGDAPAPTSTTTVNQLYSPEEAARRAKLMATAEGIYANTAGIAAGAGPTGPSAETTQAQNMLRTLAGSSAVPGMADQLQWAQQFGFNAAMDPTSAPGYQSTLDTATRKVTDAFSGPGGPIAAVRAGATAGNSGGTGSREGIAMGMANRDYLNTIGDVSGQFASNAYGQGLDLFSKTMAMAPQTMAAVQGAENLPATYLGAIGQQNEAYDQAKRMWELEAPWAALGPYASTVHGMASPGTQTTATGPAPRANPMAPLGMALTGASMGAMMGGPTGAMVGAGAGLLLSLFD